jgi:hypothetical protein
MRAVLLLGVTFVLGGCYLRGESDSVSHRRLASLMQSFRRLAPRLTLANLML